MTPEHSTKDIVAFPSDSCHGSIHRDELTAVTWRFFPTEWALWLQLVEEFHIEGIALPGSNAEKTWSGVADDVANRSWEAGVPFCG